MRECTLAEVKDGELIEFRAPYNISAQLRIGSGVAPSGYYRFWRVRGKQLHRNSEEFPWPYFGIHNFSEFSSQNVRVLEVRDLSPTDRASMATRVNSETGSDPEMFIVKDGKLVPAFTFLKKKNTRSSIENRPAYCDGFAAEFAVSPFTCHERVVSNIHSRLSNLTRDAANYGKLTIQNAFLIPQDIMDAATDEQIALGCEPSLNAYGDMPTIPDNPRSFPWRFAGGHVHFSMKVAAERMPDIVKGCDLIAGIASVALFENFDNPLRRRYYGRAGEYRTPQHGLEYRVLSNAWLCDPRIAHLTLNLVRSGTKVGYSRMVPDFGLAEERIREIINEMDVKGAREFVLANLPVYESLLQYDGTRAGTAFKRVIQGGVEALINNPDDIMVNWNRGSNSSFRWADHANARTHI